MYLKQSLLIVEYIMMAVQEMDAGVLLQDKQWVPCQADTCS